MHSNYDDQGNRTRLARLAERGVRAWGPERVYVGEEVHLDRICPGAELINASLTGENTFIGSQAQIGISGLARIHESQIGSSAVLGAGSYERCVLLGGAKTRGFAEVRQGTVLEEEAEVGHNVGLKNTVFTTGAVAGSCINYCDVLLTGGSSRSDHSEIGSGAIHFNFDPRGDKFGSLLGDATGCLLRARRIFVGGNSGVVAPVHLQFGVVIAAGSMVRKDVGENQLSWGEPAGQGGDYDLERYYDLSRKFCATAKLVGSLHALRAWYQLVRSAFAESEGRVLFTAAGCEFNRHIEDRTQQLLKVVDKLERSLSKPCATSQDRAFHRQHRKLLGKRDQIQAFFLHEDYPKPPASFISEYEEHRRRQEHIASVRALTQESVELSSKWLRGIADAPFLQMQALFT